MQPISSLIPGALASATTSANTSSQPTGWTPKFDAYEPSLVIAARSCARYVELMEKGGSAHWLTLSGVAGCGKTMLARQVLEQAHRINPGNPANNSIWPPNWENSGAKTYDEIGRRPNCVWYDSAKFARRLREGEYDLPEYLRDDFFVALDDLGAARDKTDFLSDALYRLANVRMNRWTVFTTNLSLPEIADRMDDRIASRLIREENVFVTITAGDYALVNRT